MAIKLGDKDLFPYLGDYRPVNIYKGAHKVAGWKWAEQSGEGLHFENTYNDFVEVGIDGDSYQHAGSGKNLVRNFDERSWSYLGLNYHIDKYNNITINGTSEAQHWVGVDVPMNITYGTATWQDKDLYLLKENTDYILRTHVISGNYSGGFRVFILPKRDSYSFEKPIQSTDLLDSPIVNTGSDNLYSHFMIRANADTVFNNFKFKMQLEEGSTATEYEPPAPSPEYPIEIHSLNDFDVVSSQAINMFNSEDFIKNGIDNGLPETNTTLIEVDGHSGFQHRPIAYAENYFNYLEGQFEENTGYTFSFEYDFTGSNESSGSGMIIVYTTGEWDRVKFKGLSDSGKVSIKTDPKRTVRSLTVGGWAHGGNFKVWKISLIKTSDFKGLIPHVKDITENDNYPLIDKINLLLSEPLRSVGDVKDRLFRDSDGLWKIERNVGYQEIDNNTSITLSKSTRDIYYVSIRLQRKGLNFKDDKNTHLNNIKNPYAESDDNIYFVYDSSLRVRLLSGMTLDDYKAFFDGEMDKGVPFTVQYSLADSVIETLDQELQDKLNNLRSFQDSNYVYTVVENFKPTLHARLKVKDI